MRISTDGVLLGAWTAAGPATRRIADIGTGCGIVALMLAQRAPMAVVDAVEMASGACMDAACNFASAPWPGRLRLHPMAFEDFSPAERYDVIASNPPFFTETLTSPDADRAAARHAASLSFDALAQRAGRLLMPNGRLSVILPAAYDGHTLYAATLAGLHPTRRTSVRPTEAKEPVRTLWEFAACDDEGACEETTLVLRDSEGQYTEQYIALTRDFHPHLI